MMFSFKVSKSKYLILFFTLFCSFLLCCQTKKTTILKSDETSKIIVGAERIDLYIKLLTGKKIAIVANQTSIIETRNKKEERRHLVDSLLSLQLNIKKVFAPEHGFRGDADAGEYIKNSVDTKTNLPIISLYGTNKKPSQTQLLDIDIVLFDIQDVGVRFYTYISTLHYVMEACAEAKIPLLVLDRPNPNAHYIDGPILEKKHESFVGMHPVPVVYGLTIGEYAQMINGENWLANNLKCDVKVIPLKNYNHQMSYTLPVKPSPNLPNDVSINLYPSLCFFEGTNVSVGRGTDMQFQIYGSPFLPKSMFSFVPKPNEGAKNPMYENKVCYGEDLRTTSKLNQLDLSWLLKAYQTNTNSTFFNSFFTKLAGTTLLEEQIKKGFSEQEIKKSWEKDLENFKKTRAKYLIYK